MLKKESGADFRATLSLPVAAANKNLSHPLERATGNVNYVRRQGCTQQPADQDDRVSADRRLSSNLINIFMPCRFTLKGSCCCSRGLRRRAARDVKRRRQAVKSMILISSAWTCC